MINEASLALEREERLANLEAKLSLKLTKLKEKYQKEFDEQVASFEKCHDKQEVSLFKIALKLDQDNKIAKAQLKYEKKLDHEKNRLEVRSKEFLTSSKRIFEIDLLRGIAIWGMIFDHYVFDFYGFFNYFLTDYQHGWFLNAYNFASQFWNSDFRIGVRLFGVFLFVFLCGVSARFARNNLNRSLLICFVGLVITGVLNCVSFASGSPSYQVLLSTIFVIGLCLAIYSLISGLFKKLMPPEYWKWTCLTICVAMFIFWFILCSQSYLVEQYFDYDRLWSRFFFIFNSNGNDIGWINSGFSSLEPLQWWQIVIGLKGFGADWLGLFPYIGFIFFGGFVGETLYKDKKSIIKYFYKKEDRLLNGDAYLETKQGQLNAKLNRIFSPIIYPGRHTMLVYIFHQPIFISLMIPVFLLTGYQFKIFS